MSLPKMRTQEDVTRERVEIWKNGSERDKTGVLLSAFFDSSYRGLPTTDDHHKIVQDSVIAFKNRDFSEAESAVESLGEIVEFYKDLAERYRDDLERLGTVFHESGEILHDPFVIVGEGDEMLGRIEVLYISDHYTPDSDGSLWKHYIEPFLTIANEDEREWIADRFADNIVSSQKEEL